MKKRQSIKAELIIALARGKTERAGNLRAELSGDPGRLMAEGTDCFVEVLENGRVVDVLPMLVA